MGFSRRRAVEYTYYIPRRCLTSACIGLVVYGMIKGS